MFNVEFNNFQMNLVSCACYIVALREFTSYVFKEDSSNNENFV